MRGKQVALAQNTATKVCSNVSHRALGWVLITNSSAGALLVGGSDVSATVFGASMAASAQQAFFVGPGDDLYIFSAAATPGNIGILATPGGPDVASDVSPLG